MNAGHTAALELVGWLLLIPHYGLDGRLLDSAPLSTWKVHDRYDSLNACEQTRQQMVEIGHEFAMEQEKQADLEGMSQAATLLASKCVSSDDARLKGN